LSSPQILIGAGVIIKTIDTKGYYIIRYSKSLLINLYNREDI
jgi:hypothetical protein